MINFRYNILRKLGEGGGGEVFLVEDALRRNARCALKALHHAESTSGQQFRNEISALVHLHHPNLLRVFDFGLIRSADDASLSGRSYFTMEFVEGTDILHWYRRRRSNEGKANVLGGIFLQALGVLSYIHREGVVHFDIKPQNLLLVEETTGAPPILKLTDFGFSRRAESAPGLTLRGTLEYTAPELLRAAPLRGRRPNDHRVDLYSLGATFFHVMEDRCPFEAVTPVDLIRRALNDEARFSPASMESMSVLCIVVTKLLEKDPSNRFQSADEAAAALIAQSSQSIASAFIPSTKPRFVGRRTEQLEISSAILTLKQERTEGANSIVVSGPEGVGKTALLSEMTKLARTEGIPVFVVEALQQGIPFRAVSSVLGLLRAQALSFSDDGRNLVQKSGAVLSALLDERGTATGLQLHGWEKEKEKLIDLVSHFVIEASVLFPFVLVVDDLPMIDDESRWVLMRIARSASGRILLLMAGEERFAGGESEQSIRLSELVTEDVVEMSKSVFGSSELAEGIGASLFRLYGGTPSVLVEAIRTMRDLLPTGTSRSGAAVGEFVDRLAEHLPETIDQFLVNRYRRLAREQQMCIDVLSCFQSPALKTVLQRVLPFHPRRTDECLTLLESEGYLHSLEGGQRISFRQAKLRSIVYSSIGDSGPELHKMIASAFQNEAERLSFHDLEEVGYQLELGNNRVSAAEFFEKAADEGLRLSAFQRSIELYRDALQCIGSDRPRNNLLRRKVASAYLQGGDYKSAIDTSRELLDEQETSNDHFGPLYRIIGLAQSRLGEYEPSKRNILEALSDATDESDKMELRQELVGIDIALGNFHEAEKACLTQLQSAERREDHRLLAAVCTDLGIATFFQDRFEDAANYFARSLEVYTKIDEKYRVIDAMINIGNAMSARGDIEAAIEYWNKALQASREYGSLHQQSQIENNLGIAHYKLKKYNQAKTFYANARDISRRLGSKAGIAYALTNLGEVSLAEGEYENALKFWSECRALYEEMDDAHGLADTLLQLSEVWLTLGDLESAASVIAEANTIINGRNLETFKGQMQFVGGLCNLQQRNFASALDLFALALKTFDAAGEKEKALMCSVRLAECLYLSGAQGDAATSLSKLLENPEVTGSPQTVAEALYLLGTIAREVPGLVAKRPLVLLKQGLEAIAKEPVTELTWKLAFTLAREYHERGQSDRSMEYLTKAKLVLQFFLSHFSSHEPRQQYLASDNRGQVLAVIEARTKM